MSCDTNSYNVCREIARKAMAFDLITIVEKNRDKEAYSAREVVQLVEDYINGEKE